MQRNTVISTSILRRPVRIPRLTSIPIRPRAMTTRTTVARLPIDNMKTKQAMAAVCQAAISEAAEEPVRLQNGAHVVDQQAFPDLAEDRPIEAGEFEIDPRQRDQRCDE